MSDHLIGAVGVTCVPEVSDVRVAATWLLSNIHEFAPDIAHFDVRIQTFLIRTPDNVILVDTCCGNGRCRPGQEQFENLDTDFIERLAGHGVRVEDVDIIVVTHFHFDHVGWNTTWIEGAWRPTFPNARYLFAKGEVDFWRNAQEGGFGSQATRQAFHDSVAPILESGQAVLLDQLESARDFDRALELIPLPGHTPHHLGVRIESDGAVAIILGDAIHSPMQVCEPRLHNGGDVCRETALETRKQLIAQCLDRPILLFLSHVSDCGISAGYVVTGPDGPRFEFATADDRVIGREQ